MTTAWVPCDAAAVAICSACPVVDSCRSHALTVREPYGVWGALTEDDRERILTLVGDDETDAGAGRVGWNSPIARALRGAAVGDVRRVTLPAGERGYEVLAVRYPD